MQGATVDLPQDGRASGPAEGGDCRLGMRGYITQALLRASEKDCNDSRNRFVPRCALITIIDIECAERVLRVLQATLEPGVEDMTRLQEMARDISPSPGKCICCFEYCTGRRMILATLLFCGREDLILSWFSLQNPRICDNDLPLSFHSLDVIDNNLTASEKELFIHMQWQVYTPFLTDFKADKIQSPETFPDQVSLPWMEKARLGERIPGEVSYVERIKICPQNHDLEKDDIFAVKTFEQRLVPNLSEKRFLQEVEANLYAPQHHRIVRLLTAFSYRERFYLVFPFASEGSLDKLWKAYAPNATCQQSAAVRVAHWYSDKWLVSEFLGIADALVATHHIVDDHPEGKSGLLHADIKPENILCFPNSGLVKPCIILKLADFGEAKRLHSNVDLKASRVAHVKTYRPPEHSPDSIITLNYDVWCLGCLFLDFITWAILGQDGVDSFSMIREDEADDPDVTENPGQLIEDTFFKRVRTSRKSSIWARLSLGYKRKITVDYGQATTQYSVWVASHVKTDFRVKDGVISHMRALQAHDRCSHQLRQALSFIQDKMLVVDPHTRASSREVRDFLSNLSHQSCFDE